MSLTDQEACEVVCKEIERNGFKAGPVFADGRKKFKGSKR